MKNKLVTLVALGAVAFSLTACPGPKEEKPVKPEYNELTLAELYEMNQDETASWAHEGEKVKVEHLAVQGMYGNTLIGGGALSQYIKDLLGVEIRSKEPVEFKNPSRVATGWGADINVIGTVIDVNGRLVLDEAEVEVVSERTYAQDGSYTGGIGISYCPAKYVDRSFWSQYLGRQQSGGYYVGEFQVASLPERLVAGTDTYFQVVFPGENTNAEDEDNNSLIKVQVPGSLSEGMIEAFNNYFFTEGEEVQVGDFITVDTVLQYDRAANHGMGYVFTNFGELYEVENEPYIVDSWAGVKSAFQDYFVDPIVDIESEIPFSYVLDGEFIYTDFKENWADAYKDRLVRVANSEACATLKATTNFKPYAADDETYNLDLLLEDIDKSLAGTEEAPGEYAFVEDDELASSGIWIWTKSLLDETVVAQVLVQYVNTSCVEIYYTAERIVEDADFATFALAKAAYEDQSSAFLSAIFSQAITNTSALPAFPSDEAVANINFSWANESAYLSLYSQYGLLVNYVFTVTLNEGVNPQTAGGAYLQALVGAGFVQGSYQYLSGTWFLNSTSGEMVKLGLTEDGELVLSLFILNSKSASAFTPATPAGDGE